MSKICGIYQIKHQESGKVYIGQSVDIKSRWQYHRNGYGSTYISNAIKKHGPSAFSWGVIEECVPSDLNTREEFWVREREACGPRGYNLTTGGGAGTEFPPEVRKRMSAGIKSAWRRPGVRERAVKSRKALWADPEMRAKASAASTKKWKDPEARAKVSNSVKKLLAKDPWEMACRLETLRRAGRNPDVRRKKIASIKAAWANPGTKAKASKTRKALWADPSYREMMMHARQKKRSAA